MHSIFNSTNLQVSIAEQGSRASSAFPFPVAGEAEAAFTVEVARPAREGRGEGKGREREAIEIAVEESCWVSNLQYELNPGGWPVSRKLCHAWFGPTHHHHHSNISALL